MIKYIFIIMGLWCYAAIGFGQQPRSAKEMVGITPVVPQEMELSPEVKKVLNQKLLQMVTQNGFGSFSSQFVLTSNVVVSDKQVTATVPAQFIVNLEVSVYLLNMAEMVIVDETSFVVKGIDKMENKAMIQAVNRINSRSPEVRNFMNQCRVKIIDYYTTRIPALLAKAQSLASRDQYEEALAVLSVIPESVDEYPAIAEQMVSWYGKLLNKEAATRLQEAKGKLAIQDYEGAVELLVLVDPSSVHFPEATKMIDAVKQAIDAKEQVELAEKMKKYELEMAAAQKMQDNAVLLEKTRIEAAQKMGTSYNRTKSEQLLNDSINEWFLSRFK